MEFLIIILLLIFNGLFAMYEIALVSSSKARLKIMAAKGNKRARGVLKQLSEPEKFLSAIQIGITLIGIVSGAFGGVALTRKIAPLFTKIAVLEPHAHDIAMVTVVGCITYLSLVIGELVPKSIALSNPERYATALAPVITLISRISYPFVMLLSASTKLLNRLLGIRDDGERAMTQEEIKQILHQSSKQGIIDQEETEMLNDVFRFSNKRANELMTPRRDLIALHPTDTADVVMEIIRKHRFSNYLLFDRAQDDIAGVVSVKDIVPAATEAGAFDLTAVAREPLYIPESLHANKVLEIFKRHKKKFGVVVNEYGMVEGIITLHDLTESIFGDIPEENETAAEEIVVRDDGSMLVDGAMNISDFMEQMHIAAYDDLRSEDFTTLGGMAMFLTGSIPRTGDTFSYKDLRFEIVDMDDERVDKLLVYSGSFVPNG